ncbi:MAG TPA: NAD-dependent epimerase/dehydratase family protein [Thermoplasmata archaeon]|nr:NAD-dependent epimerase/dehydratase family protein [Thermoplasmata archaeon]
MTAGAGRPKLLLVGGGGGLLGRALLEAAAPDWSIRSVHRTGVERERELGVEWIRADLADVSDWGRTVSDVDAIVNVAWYRWGSDARFRRIFDGLERLLEAAKTRHIPIVQVSVPPAPTHLESGIPYLTYKRRFDADVGNSGVPYAIVRPTMMFGRGDVLLGVMLRTARRYPVFPMFGDGTYRISPVAAADVARLVLRFARAPPNAVVDVGGPASYRYVDVTDRLFALVGKRPRYWHLSARGGVRLAGLLQSLGSTLLYAYEVEWLLSDTLALPPTPMTDGPLERVEPYLKFEAERLLGRPVPDLGPIAGRG